MATSLFKKPLILACLLGLVAGCSPAQLAMLFMPFVDDKIEPKCKLSSKEKEVTVVVASRFENLEVRPEIAPADQELAEALATQIRQRAKENREKVKVVPPLRVRPHLSKVKEWSTVNLLKVGEQFQADYVIHLSIQNMSLVMPNSFNALYQGKADIEVTVYDCNQSALEAVTFRQPFRCEYPTSRPIDAGGSSPAQFRMLFINRMGRDLARWFTAYPSDQRFDLD